ncbi:hypothetical protein LINGRAHAP2_LOCUS4179 [Linum grandiflorum]
MVLQQLSINIFGPSLVRKFVLRFELSFIPLVCYEVSTILG